MSAVELSPILASDLKEGELDVDGRRIRVSNLDRVLWPAAGFTKRQMLAYYLAVAPVLLPHLRGRGLSLRRFPEGVDGPGWYQAQCRGRPEWLATHDVLGQRGETLRYCVVADRAALAWVANLGTIELHPFLGTVQRPAEPTALVLDLDPGPPASLLASARVALRLREILDRLGLDPIVKTSGSLGLHVFVPLGRGHTFGETKAFARRLAHLLAAEQPDLVVAGNARRQRAGRVYIDWIQNDPNRSTVAPYSLRATPWPLVSMPVGWDEVDRAAATGRIRDLVFSPDDALGRVGATGDAFSAALDGRARLPDPRELEAAVARAGVPSRLSAPAP